MNLYKTNWHEKDPNDVLDVIYNELEGEASRFDFFKHLMQNYPELEIDWLETFEDMKEYLLMNKRINDIISFVDWYKARNPRDYQDRHEFIERDLCNYYLFQKDYAALKLRMDFIKLHPVKSIDTLTIRLLYQLIYHGLYDEAVEFASAVWKPIDESDELMGMPSYDFVNTIYINELQKLYEAFLTETPFDTSVIFRKATEMGFTEDKDLFDEVVNAIESDMDYELVKKSIQKSKDEHMLHLNIQFLKYMFTEYNLPFIFSELLWQFIATLKIFGKYGKDRWFFINAKTMDKYIAESLDTFYFSNTLQRFGQVWGFDYLISFFEFFQLLSEEDAAIMSENNQYFKQSMIQLAHDSLWQMNFVFNWPGVDRYEELVVNPSLFNSTFGMDGMEASDYIMESMSTIPIEPRIARELDIREKSIRYSEIDSDEPYIKKEAIVGRNDPCPCGSGKKYKKCCLDK